MTPLEIEHALIQTSGEEAEIGASLVTQGYHVSEVRRSIEHAIRHGIVRKIGTKLALHEDRRYITRQYYLLDILSIHGRDMQPGTSTSAASILVPGRGAFFGMELDELATVAIAHAGILREDISHSQTFAADIKALSQRGQCLVGR